MGTRDQTSGKPPGGNKPQRAGSWSSGLPSVYNPVPDVEEFIRGSRELQRRAEEAAEELAEEAGEAFDSARDFAGQVYDSMMAGPSAAANAARGIFDSAGEAVEDVFEGTFGVFSRGIKIAFWTGVAGVGAFAAFQIWVNFTESGQAWRGNLANQLGSASGTAAGAAAKTVGA